MKFQLFYALIIKFGTEFPRSEQDSDDPLSTPVSSALIRLAEHATRLSDVLTRLAGTLHATSGGGAPTMAHPL